MPTRTDNRELNKRLALYSGIAGVLTAGTAHAVPTSSTSPDLPLILVDTTDDSEGAVSSGFDADGNGFDDFNAYVYFRTSCTINNGYAYLDSDVGNGHLASNGPQYYAGMVSPGATISDSSDWNSSYRYLFGCSDGSGEEFDPPSRGFVGIRFAQGENTHYGYMDVSTYPGSVGVTIHSVCFESQADTAIQVGACAPERTAPVPVGGLIPLSLGILALGGLALRRRRTTQA